MFIQIKIQNGSERAFEPAKLIQERIHEKNLGTREVLNTQRM